MRTFLRFIAVPLLFLFILLFPISLMLRNVGQLVFDPATTRTLIEEQFLETERLSAAMQQMVQGLLQSQAEENTDLTPFMEKGFAALDQQDWVRITDLVAPSELILQTSDTVVTALVEWLDTEDPLPDLTLQLQPWKRNMLENGREIVAIVLDALPDCTLEELASQVLDGLTQEGDLSAAIPACKPPDPLYSTIVDNSDRFVQSFTERMPAQISLSQLPLEGFDELARAKEVLQQARFILSWSWLAVLVMGLLGVAMAATGLPGFLRWAGWPALLAGLGTLLLAFSTGLLSGDLLGRILANLFREAPALISSFLRTFVAGLGESLSQPLYLQGGFLFLIGIAFLIIARSLDRTPSE